MVPNPEKPGLLQRHPALRKLVGVAAMAYFIAPFFAGPFEGIICAVLFGTWLFFLWGLEAVFPSTGPWIRSFDYPPAPRRYHRRW